MVRGTVLSEKKVLVTGSAGFIGFHLVQRLGREGCQIVGLDIINDYYDVNLKYARLAESGIYSINEKDHTGGKNRQYNEILRGQFIQSITNPDYRFIRLNLEDKNELFSLFEKEKFDFVIHLAAQPGVRYSLENPEAYIQSNIIGFFNILETCRHYPVKQLIFASSSSVYGQNKKIPFSETDRVDQPVSLYAATKKSNEVMAYTYNHLFNIPVTGLRFFTVYGPWGRPDMSPMLFANAIAKGTPIKVFNYGDMERDLTYIDDIVESITLVLKKTSEDVSPYRIFNIGNGSPVSLLFFIELMEQAIGAKAEKQMMPMQAGDVEKTWADTTKLGTLINYKPTTKVNEGVKKFSDWFKSMRY